MAKTSLNRNGSASLVYWGNPFSPPPRPPYKNRKKLGAHKHFWCYFLEGLFEAFLETVVCLICEGVWGAENGFPESTKEALPFRLRLVFVIDQYVVLKT